jgi:xylose dehydrogenase (NAD/NADP)
MILDQWRWIMGGEVLRVGVLGTADIAVRSVIPALKRSKRVRVSALASRDMHRAKERAKELEVEHSYGSYEELLDSNSVDAVYVPLPNSLHTEWTLKALTKGKHVMCEKPLAMTSEEVIRMIRLSREKSLVLMEAFMYRFHPRNEAVFRMIREGEIGAVRAVETAFSYVLDDENSYLMSRELGGGALYDVGCYCVNVSRTVTGMEPVEVFGTMNTSKTMVDMTFTGIIRFQNGVLSSFHVSMNEEPRFYYRVTGEKGLIEVPRGFLSFGRQTHIILQKNEKQETFEFKRSNEYRLEFEHFADVVFEKAHLMYDAVDALKNTYVIEALMKSAREGKAVKV